jgi:alkylation response protein AidB-like acyl-CoA dehydrogenase
MNETEAELATLRAELARDAGRVDAAGLWPGESLERLGRAGVFRWFQPAAWGGLEWTETQLMRGYRALAAGCLTTTFILTQRVSAVRRIVEGENADLRERVLPRLAGAGAFATVGISQLTTSRRHLARPVLGAKRVAGGWVLDGVSPWVTGAAMADWIVTGAVTEEGRQLLACVDGRAAGVSAQRAEDLVALGASRTGAVRYDEVFVADEAIVAGPTEAVLKSGRSGGSGGFQTSAVALGLCDAAIGLLEVEAERRGELRAAVESLKEEATKLGEALEAGVRGDPNCGADVVRTEANSLVLRATQAALVAAKGAGFASGHPAGRYCREALFFLVWSCPAPVQAANLCELAGIAGE